MSQCQHTGLKLNPDKCFIKQEKIRFYGLICGPDGIQPDPNKVTTLKQMAPPTSSKELQAFLGLATYMAPFIPNLSHHTASLRQLLKKENQFDWNASHQDVFNRVKSLISNKVTLTYFDPQKEMMLQVDASTKGLGATLMQDNKPVAFASRALTDTKSRYAKIERELLAVVYGCEKFHTYLYGCSLQSSPTTSPSNLSTLNTLPRHHHICNECCCAYNRTILRSNTDQAQKSPTPCRGFCPMKQSQFQIWTSKSMQYAHNSTMKYCKRFAWQLTHARSSKT